jgi:hypothetical protein
MFYIYTFQDVSIIKILDIFFYNKKLCSFVRNENNKLIIEI